MSRGRSSTPTGLASHDNDPGSPLLLVALLTAGRPFPTMPVSITFLEARMGGLCPRGGAGHRVGSSRAARRACRVVVVKVYTGHGDDGTTGLFHGGRVSKASPAPEAYGTVDEAVAALGLARVESEPGSDLHEILLTLQRDLFVVGAELATLPENRGKLDDGVTLVSQEMCDRLKVEVERLEAELPELTEFVIPGGERVPAALDHARTVIRRAERRAAELAGGGALPGTLVVAYLNRLGDLVYLLARRAETRTRTLHGD